MSTPSAIHEAVTTDTLLFPSAEHIDDLPPLLPYDGRLTMSSVAAFYEEIMSRDTCQGLFDGQLPIESGPSNFEGTSSHIENVSPNATLATVNMSNLNVRPSLSSDYLDPGIDASFAEHTNAAFLSTACHYWYIFYGHLNYALN